MAPEEGQKLDLTEMEAQAGAVETALLLVWHYAVVPPGGNYKTGFVAVCNANIPITTPPTPDAVMCKACRDARLALEADW